jgi:hypothetical protein
MYMYVYLAQTSNLYINKTHLPTAKSSPRSKDLIPKESINDKSIKEIRNKIGNC